MRADNNRVEKLVFGIFACIGTVFFVLGILLGAVLSKDNKEDYVPVTATISDITRYSDEHRVYIDYEYAGHDYTRVHYNRYSSGMHIGNEIEVLVNKYDPTHFYMGGIALMFLLVFGGMGLTFMLIGGIPLVIIRKKALEQKRIKEIGQGVWGVINGVKINRNISVNNRHPYILNIKYEDESIVTTKTDFLSKSVWFDTDPQAYIGKSIRVYIDPANPAKYFVDIDSVGGGDNTYGY